MSVIVGTIVFSYFSFMHDLAVSNYFVHHQIREKNYLVTLSIKLNFHLQRRSVNDEGKVESWGPG